MSVYGDLHFFAQVAESPPDSNSEIMPVTTLNGAEANRTEKGGTLVGSDELDSPGSSGKQYSLASIITSQFGNAWDMLEKAMRNFTENQWRSGDCHHFIPARLAYHAIETVDYYLRDDLTAFKWGWRFGVDWQGASPSQLPDLRSTLSYLHETRRQGATWVANLGDDGLLGPDETFHTEGISHLDRVLYVLRHTHHHVGEICGELRKRKRPRPPWK